jgi:hypothetical protein
MVLGAYSICGFAFLCPQITVERKNRLKSVRNQIAIKNNRRAESQEKAITDSNQSP